MIKISKLEFEKLIEDNVDLDLFKEWALKELVKRQDEMDKLKQKLNNI